MANEDLLIWRCAGVVSHLEEMDEVVVAKRPRRAGSGEKPLVGRVGFGKCWPCVVCSDQCRVIKDGIWTEHKDEHKAVLEHWPILRTI